VFELEADASIPSEFILLQHYLGRIEPEQLTLEGLAACAGVLPALMDWCQEMLARYQTYIREHFEDMPEVRDWVWTDM
jgi:xylulose-5-phosphate/fructose-6-phosphate phosphoketolase